LSVLVDSCSDANIINVDDVKKFDVQLKQCGRKLYPYGCDKPLKVVGSFDTEIVYQDTSVYSEFVVVENKGVPLLCREDALALGLLDLKVNSVQTKEGGWMAKYPDVFSGIGKLRDYQLKLHVDPNVEPVAQPQRRVPYTLRKAVEHKLEELLKLDIIEPVDGPTDWVSPPVIVPKPNSDDIRFCIDMRRANEAVQRVRYPIPTIDDVLLEMNGSTKFSKIDLKWAFHQIELEENSRNITTFVTDKGLLRYKRLLYGVNAAPEIFQHTIEQVLQGVEGACVIADDIIVHGTDDVHDDRVDNLLKTLQDKGLTANPDKCMFGMDKLVFSGHVLSSMGLKPAEKKIEAIREVQRPESPAEVRSFLGLVGYMGRYIPDPATREEPLRRLTRSKEPWSWGSEQEVAFQDLKDALTSDTTMAYYSRDRETRVVVDVSPVGLGAILLQKQDDGNFKPVQYASRSLTDTERRYSQTEKEALAVVWSCERFHLYLYGIVTLL
jgi:hypothetical protein